MPEKISTVYANETYEAIRLFTDSYSRYIVSLQKLAPKLKTEEKENTEKPKKISLESLKSLENIIDELKYYETHAFLRLKAISSIQGIDLVQIEKQRKTLETVTPERKDLENLVNEYHKVLATKLTEASFSSPSGEVEKLTKSL